MKLDSIIYDKDTLAAAIAEQWNLESATFSAMYPSETSTALVNGMAAYGSMLQYMLVAQLANCYLDTAFSDNAVYQLADTLGNDLHGNGPAHVLCNMSKNNLVNFDIVVPANTQFRLDNKTFYNDSAIILPSNVTKVTDINLTQGEVITETKTTSGLENEKLYFGSNFEVYSESVKVWVNDERWQVSDSFLPYNQYEVLDTSDMNTVVFKTCADGRCYIKLGNGDFANLPTAGSIVKIQYVKNLGTGGNIEEINIDGTIVTPLTFLDNHNKEVNLDLTITSTTPAYGGFSKQSVDLLRQTSPAVFASGHRAVRRSDYNAIFRNKLGYITSQTWGEYEEAKDQGIDDAIMMNVVYYTGLKSYQHTPYYEIGAITNTESYEGSVGTTRGFHGSYNIKMFNASDTENNMVYKDNSGKGILFIDNLAEALDTDDLISTWNCPEGTTTHPYLHIEDRYGTLTNDPSEAHANPVENIISSKDGYFLSRHEPSLENPTQIILDFTGIKYPQGDESVTRQGISIAGFSFMPMAGYSFIDQFAVYGTNTLTIPDTTNVRNSTQWTKLVDKQEPVKNGNNYTEWVATNCFLNKTSYDDAPASKKAAYDDPNACKDDLSIPYWKYNYYIIEIYSSDRDMLQLINGLTSVMLLKSGVSVVDEFNNTNFSEKFMGLKPEQITDFKGMAGDNSDHLKGIEGIGPKTAANMLIKYGNIDNIYLHIDELTPKAKTSLLENKQQALDCKELATIYKDLFNEKAMEEFNLTTILYDELYKLADENNLNQLKNYIRKIEKLF